VTNALESARTEAVRKAVDIVASIDPAAAVLGDEGALTEAVLNVVGNAVKYSREGGRVTVSAVCRGGKVVVSVADTGVGITEVEMPRLFGAFYRGRAGDSGVAGAGIGLALTRRIVEAHDGSITATSASAKGSGFVIPGPALGTPAPGLAAAPPEQLSKGEAG